MWKLILGQLRGTESKVVVTRGWEDDRHGEIVVKGYKIPVMRLINSGDLMSNMVILANNTVLYT